MVTPEFGSFSDNWQALAAASLAVERGDIAEGLACARRLLAHIDSIDDRKSSRFIRPSVERLLRGQRNVFTTAPTAA